MTEISNVTPSEGTPELPHDAWASIRIEAETNLLLSTKHSRRQFELTLVNHSPYRLSPGLGKGLVFSYKLLAEDGSVLPFECPRTPLREPVEPGGRHTQTILIEIPAAFRDKVHALRVGMLKRGDYWAERFSRDHPRVVHLDWSEETDPTRLALREASTIWPRDNSNRLKWPYSSMMVSEKHRLLYIPIAKCACTSLKSLMVRLAGIDRPERAVQLGVHLVTDRFNTGVQLKDKPMPLAREIIASRDYFKFVVIREPFERLVSAYLEKFVYNRRLKRNLIHTLPVIKLIQGTDNADLERGITFEEFVGFILASDPWDLDPHWRPQNLYFRGVPHINRIYRLEHLGELEAQLRASLDLEVSLGHENRTRKSALVPAGAVSMTAVEIEAHEGLNPASFAENRLVGDLQRYYAEDFAHYLAAT